MVLLESNLVEQIQSEKFDGFSTFASSRFQTIEYNHREIIYTSKQA